MAKKKIQKEVSVDTIKETLNAKIIEQYGSIAAFINSDYAKKHKIGKNIRVYLSKAGGVSLKLFKELYNHFGLGELRRGIIVTRKTTYLLDEKETTKE